LEDVEETLRASLLLALAGDSEAYAAFLTQSGAHLRAYFRRRLVTSPDEVEDLVQETLLALHNRRHTYQTTQRLTPWLYAIAATSWSTCCARSPASAGRGLARRRRRRERAGGGRCIACESRRTCSSCSTRCPTGIACRRPRQARRSLGRRGSGRDGDVGGSGQGRHPPRPEEAGGRSEQAAMKTDALIAMLARGTPRRRAGGDRTAPGRDRRRGPCRELMVVLATLGARADIAAAAMLPMFW
jgi:hypothetical protein